MAETDTAQRNGRLPLLTGVMCLGLALNVGLAEPPAAQRSPAAKAFQQRVEQYMKVREAAAKTVPELDDTKDPQKISSREKALGEAIRKARGTARQGELFGAAPELFASVVHRYWKALGAEERQELMEELPSKARPAVNVPYPTTYPLVTFPPTLLSELPELPDTLEYRLVGPHLILRDIQANLVVDVLPNAADGTRAAARRGK